MTMKSNLKRGNISYSIYSRYLIGKDSRPIFIDGLRLEDYLGRDILIKYIKADTTYTNIFVEEDDME
jgi:hypothetical protein